MRNYLIASFAVVLSSFAFGCGSGADGTLDQPAAQEAPVAESPLSEDVKCKDTELTVKNYLAWCDVTVGSGAASSATEQKVCVDGPTTLDLKATPLTGFVLGKDPWHDTTTASAGSATLDVAKGKHKACAWVCCPGKGGSAPCPTTDQCE